MLLSQTPPAVCCCLEYFVASGAWTIETKGPWPPSKFGLCEKRQYSPLDKFSWPPHELKRGPLTFFDQTPLFGESPSATVCCLVMKFRETVVPGLAVEVIEQI